MNLWIFCVSMLTLQQCCVDFPMVVQGFSHSFLHGLDGKISLPNLLIIRIRNGHLGVIMQSAILLCSELQY
jgi:hypothetical protein